MLFSWEDDLSVGARYVDSAVCGREVEIGFCTRYKASFVPKDTPGAKLVRNLMAHGDAREEK
jgi:hypothetical protein